MIERLDDIHRWIRAQPLLYRFTLGTRLLLACGFLPTGLLKVLGRRFTIMPVETPPGFLFEALYQGGGLYWRFIGLSQVIASILLLIPRTSAIGAIIFLPIIANIFVITVSYGFVGTPFITGPMLLAALWLVAWEWHRLRPLVVPGTTALAAMPQQRLDAAECIVYTAGALAGFYFFFVVRSLVPKYHPMALLGFAALCLFAAAALGIRRQFAPRPA
ncbi:MAG TPA: hypothetical protein VF039_00925 [Longimicrobiales bacterium]